MNKSKKKTACLKNSKLSLSKKVIKQHVLPFRCVGNEYKHALFSNMGNRIDWQPNGFFSTGHYNDFLTFGFQVLLDLL